MKRTNSSRTRRAKKATRFTTPRMLKAIASLGGAVAGKIATKLGDDSRDGRRKLSVMLNRAKKLGLVKHTPTGSSALARAAGGRSPRPAERRLPSQNVTVEACVTRRAEIAGQEPTSHDPRR